MYEVKRFGPVVRIRMVPTFLGRRLLPVNAFWVEGLLIDSGCKHTVPDLIKALEDLPVRQLVNTHTDEDHVAGNAEVHRRFNIKPKAHPLGLERLARPETAKEMAFYRRFYWGEAPPCPGEPLGDHLEAGPYRFQVIEAPGHMRDQVALWEEREGWLFSADVMISPRLSSVRAREETPVALETLRRLAALPVRKLFCSHAGKVHESAEPLKAKLAYWEQLQRDGRALSKQGFSLAQVTRRLLGRDGLTEWITRGDVSKQNLMAGLLQDR